MEPTPLPVPFPDLAVHPDARPQESLLLHSLLQSTDYGVLVSGLDRQDILANRRLGELFAVPPDLVVQTDPDAVRALALARVRNPDEFDATLNRIYADPLLTLDDEIELDTDPIRFLRRFTAPIQGKEGQPVGRLWTFLDVSETRRLQMEVQAQLAARTEEYTLTSHVLNVINALCPTRLAHREPEALLADMVRQVASLSSIGSAALLLGTSGERAWTGMGAAHTRPTFPLTLYPGEEVGWPQEAAQELPATFLFAAPQSRLLRALHSDAVILVPLRAETHRLGVLAFGVVDNEPEANHTLRAVHLIALADQIAHTLETCRLQRELQTALHSLQEAQERMVQMEKIHIAGTLAASVAHDIRNIVAAMQIEIEALPPAAFDTVAEQLTRFSALTHRLLAFSRPHSLELQPTSIANVIERIVPLIASQAEVNRVHIVTRLPASLPYVHADASQLENLFVNLSLNAIQAMTTHGGTLSFTACLPNSDWIQIEVDDTGTGISTEHIDRLFDPFFTTRATGTGLGLFSCKRIIEEHGGQISVASETGKGARFTLLLPITKESDV